MIAEMLTRRSVLTGVVAGSLALAKSKPPRRNMFLALNSVLVGGRVKWPEFARLAAQIGYPGTDVMLGSAMQQGVDATNQLLQSLHILPAAIDLPVEFRKDDAAFEASMAKLRPAAQFAAQIKCPRMVTYIFPSSDTPAAELRATYKKRFTEVAQVLADQDVRLGLEFLGPLEFRTKFKYEFIWRMNDMLQFTEEIGPNVGLLLDSWHWHWSGATTDDIVHAGRKRIVHVHFNDAAAQPAEQVKDDQRLLPGEGVINLVGFLRALHQIGYDDALSVEVFGRMRDATPEEAARKGLESSVAVFKKAGVPEGFSANR